MVGRRGLVVTESVVTGRLGRVEGISMNLQTLRFPGENLLHREELEGGGVSVHGLRKCSLLHFFVFFKPLRYTCRRSHRVLERRLVQPRDSVSHLRITQVLQRGPGRSLCLSRVDFVQSLWCSHSLSDDLILRCRDLLTVTLVFLVIRNGSLGIRVHRCSEVDWRLICAVHSTDEDLESGERDLDSLDSLWLLACLTGVLACLTGVLACLSGALACLTRELMELCGVWRNLSVDLGLLSGVLAGVADLLLVESCLGAGIDDWTAGLVEHSGTLGWSIRCCINVHKDIKSTSVAWLMVFGMEGKSKLLVPVNVETSGPLPGAVAAGVPCPADPSTPSARRRAGPSDSSGPVHQSVDLSCEMTQLPRHPLGCHWPGRQLWPGRPLWPGRDLWPSRDLWPGHPLWPGHHLWPNRHLWPGRCVLLGRHLWPSRRLPPGQHLPGRPPPVPGLELLGPIQHEPAGPAKRLPWLFSFQEAWRFWETAAHPVWRRTSDPSYRHSLVFSRGDWAVTYGRETPEMKLMKGIYDRPRNDDDDERKKLTDGCPTPWRHCRTRHVSGSWNRPRNLVGTARPLAGRCCGRHAVTTGVSENPVVCRPRVFSCALDSLICSDPTRESWAVPLPRRWKPRTSVERILNSWLFSSLSSWTTPQTWHDWKVVVKPLPERGSPRNHPWSLQWLCCLRRSGGLASILLSLDLGLRSPRLRQPVFANETGSVLSTKWLPLIQTALLAAKMVVIPTTEMRTSRKLRLGFSWRRPVAWSLRHFVHTGTAWQRRKHGFTPKPTWPNSAWDQLASLRTATHYSSFFVFDKRLGRPPVQWVTGLASVH